MWRTTYLITGSLVCLTFGVASLLGWSYFDFGIVSRAVLHGPNVYHK